VGVGVGVKVTTAPKCCLLTNGRNSQATGVAPSAARAASGPSMGSASSKLAAIAPSTHAYLGLFMFSPFRDHERGQLKAVGQFARRIRL